MILLFVDNDVDGESEKRRRRRRKNKKIWEVRGEGTLLWLNNSNGNLKSA